MIRREVQLPGELPQWLLTTQIEHARVSGRLADRCLLKFGQSSEVDGLTLPGVRNELLAAVLHHDDGWAARDAHPQLDAKFRRPPSFRELPLEFSLSIWSSSIETAATFGPLAAWVVAGHFLALLLATGKSITPQATAWHRDTIAQRGKWLADWQAIDRSLHSRALADDALRWLQWFDVMSLWLCSVCTGRDEQQADVPKRYRAFPGELLETQFGYEQRQVRIEPWRFDMSSFQVTAVGWVVPIRKYGSVDELLAARVTHTVQWDFADPASGLDQAVVGR